MVVELVSLILTQSVVHPMRNSEDLDATIILKSGVQDVYQDSKKV